jgi:hypothetical protein
MKKHLGVVLSLVCLCGFLLLSACGEDEPPIATISFASPEITVNEADDVIEIEVTLNRPAEADFFIDYTVSGSAQDAATAGANVPVDFEILEDLNDYGEIEIKKGETKGIIEIQLYSDFDFENDETIEIQLESEDGKYAELTRDDELEITVAQEDGLAIVLDWNDPAYTNVDMDLFLWAQNTGGSLGLTNIASANASTSTKLEVVFIPDVVDDGNYGISCNYYAGTANPLNFTVTYYKIEGGDDVSTTERFGTYDLDNINAWDVTDIDPLLAATYTKTGSSYSNFSEILVTTNTTGSRTAPTIKNLNLKKGVANLPVFKKK